jgi:hypothetical protein
MKFDYLKVPQEDSPSAPWLLKPHVKVRLSAGSKSVGVFALIDSGADASLFHASLAEVLGINLTSGMEHRFFGIEGKPVIAYFHKVRLQLVGMPGSLDIAVAFTNSEGVGALLGQADFFHHYKVTFERYKERMEISPAK